MTESSEERGSGSAARDSLVGLCGLVTSLLTAVLLWWLQSEYEFAFYSWTFWFVIPVGAFFSGFAGASGYYAGARMFHHRPTRLLLLNVLLASIGTFFTVHLLTYFSLKSQGHPISESVSFGRYLDVAIRSASMQFRFHSMELGGTGELGGLGYLVAALQILGFGIGGASVYGYLQSIPYCGTCRRYFAAKGKQVRYTGDGEALDASRAEVIGAIGEDAAAAAMEKHGAFGRPKQKKGDHLRSVFELRHCTQCGQHWLKYAIERLTGGNWKEIQELTVEGLTGQPVDR